MNELMPPRPLSVTTAAVLALTTGCYWLGVIGFSLWEMTPGRVYSQRLIVLSSVLGCMSVSTVIVGFGLLFRRNWGRIFAILLAGPWILFRMEFSEAISPATCFPGPPWIIHCAECAPDHNGNCLARITHWQKGQIRVSPTFHRPNLR